MNEKTTIYQFEELPRVHEEAIIGLHDPEQPRRLKIQDVQSAFGCCYPHQWAIQCSVMMLFSKGTH